MADFGNRDFAVRGLQYSKEVEFPGFPGGHPCPRCIAGWLLILATILAIGRYKKMTVAEVLGWVAVAYAAWFLYRKFKK